MTRALLIPVEGPVRDIEFKGFEDLQGLVGGYIEAVPLPSFIEGADRATAYVNEEGKYQCEPNMRATDFMVPGVGLFAGDYIAGSMVLCGFDPRTGEETSEIPLAVEGRVRLIEKEAA